MKKTYSVIRNILAIIGGITIIAAIIVWIESPNYDFYLEKNNVGLYDEHVELLRTSGEYAADTNVFEMKIAQNEVRAQEIRDYFQLDTLYPENATTWEKVVAIGKFVSCVLALTKSDINITLPAAPPSGRTIYIIQGGSQDLHIHANGNDHIDRRNSSQKDIDFKRP